MNHLDNYAGPEPTIATAQTLLRRGGHTPQGFPIYRLVRTEHVIEQVGGSWNIWDENLDVNDRGGIVTGDKGLPTQSFHRPEKVVIDVIAVQKYSHLDEHGWMLERWYPPVFFGSPESWAENVVPGSSVPLLGPFPTLGRYIEIYGAVKFEPPISFLEDFIADWEERRAGIPEDVEKHIANRVNEALEREAKRSDHALRDNYERIMDSVRPLTSTTLEAGRWRSQKFRRAGFTSHIGN